MQLLDQHSKKIMEGCKEKAREFGLTFENQTLEYIVTNKDLLELMPKIMIPTLYDFWVHDVEVLKGKGQYELYPQNPFETVINTRPAISFYNDNNPDWLNIMIFYHVLAHIDFFQNNLYYQHTWNKDFNGDALADKRTIARLRSEHGRWLDYVLEFARSIDNLVGYHQELRSMNKSEKPPTRLDYCFDVFFQEEINLSDIEYHRELEKYNQAESEEDFFVELQKRYPEFQEKFKKHLEKKNTSKSKDILEFLINNSPKLQQEDNKWMKRPLEIVRRTSLFFQPQKITQIMNEGWATYWHERLFLDDERIKGHETDFAKMHANVASLKKVGLNPYAIGSRLFEFIEESADQGKDSWEFEHLLDITERQRYDQNTGRGEEAIFQARKNLCDFSFLRNFITQDFVNKHRLFVAGERLNKSKRKWEYYVKSRKAEDYRKMLMEKLPHTPQIEFWEGEDSTLKLRHTFEGKPLVEEHIPNVMKGLHFLWGGSVELTTHVVSSESTEEEIKWNKVVYTIKNDEIKKTQ